MVMYPAMTAENARVPTAAESAHFAAHGWALLREFVRPEVVAGIRNEAHRLMGARADQGKRSESGFAAIWRTFDEPSYQSDSLWRFATSAGVGRAGSTLLRDRPVRFLRDEIYVKMPVGTGEGDATPWHQDFPYANRDRSGQVNFWVALEDVQVGGGGLRYLSGSHRFGMLGRALGDPHNDLVAQYPELLAECEASPPMQLHRGDAFAHHGLTVHCAEANTSDAIRWAYTVVLFQADSLYTGAPWSSRLANRMAGIRVGEPFDHPLTPVVWPRPTT